MRDRRGLAVGAHHVDGAEALVRRVERGHQPAHALEPEAHPEHLERVEVALGVAQPARARCRRPEPLVLELRELALEALELLALLLDDCRRRLLDESLVGELAARALDLGSQRVALGARCGAAPPPGRPCRSGSTSTVAPGPIEPDRLAVRCRRLARGRSAQARIVPSSTRRSRRRASPHEPRRDSRRRRRAHESR